MNDEKNKKPFYKKWWIILIALIAIVMIISVLSNPQSTKEGFKAGYEDGLNK